MILSFTRNCSWKVILDMFSVDEFETPLHLFQLPLYSGKSGVWRYSFVEAVEDVDSELTWDIASILAIIGNGYTYGNRTLVNEVKRRPWLSRISGDTQFDYSDIAKHSCHKKSHNEIAHALLGILKKEALEVCFGQKEVSILLSGGLDSRVVAGVIAQLKQDGLIEARIMSITWGLEGSRDLQYAKAVSEVLGFEWNHIPINEKTVIYNTLDFHMGMGTLVSPIHLHAFASLHTLSTPSIALAGCYGDSIGRAEYSGQHVLELKHLLPVNKYGLIRKGVLPTACDRLLSDLRLLHKRSGDQRRYVQCELEMQAFYMRNMIAHAMSSGNNSGCRIYQMFTHPEVYSFMWSIHPSLRDDRVYKSLLPILHPDLANIPWARTNRPLSNKAFVYLDQENKEFHKYEQWTRDCIFDQLREYIDPKWFGATEIFDAGGVDSLCKTIRRNGKGPIGIAPYEKWLWLVSFRVMAESLAAVGRPVKFDGIVGNPAKKAICNIDSPTRGLFVNVLRRHRALYVLAAALRDVIKRIRKALVKYGAIIKYPPTIG